MNDAEAVTVKLAELLRNPDDLDKISALKSEFTRKKAAVDGQLRLGLQEQLNITQSGMSSISDGQKTVELIKAELQKIDKLCSEAQTLITDFPHINLVSLTHRNFSAVEQMRTDIDEFDRRLGRLDYLLNEDDNDMQNQPNLLAIHYELTKLRDLKDSALDQAQRAGEAAEELINNLALRSGATLQDHFNRLNELIDWFDDHIGILCMNLIPLVSENPGIVVRVALIIEQEERNDKKARALQDARHEYSELAGKFETITTNKKEVRGYKEKFLKAIEIAVEPKFQRSLEKFEDDPDKLEKSFAWWFNDLNTVKLGMVNLMPKKWKIFQTFAIIYHKMMHDWLKERIDDPNLRPLQMLSIVDWSNKFYSKTRKLGLQEEWQRPHVIDDRAGELIREYRELIIKAVDEWMDRMGTTDKQSFEKRDETALDENEYGCFRTKTMADMWRMLKQQIDLAGSSGRTDIIEGVVDAMFRALQSRQRMWEQIIDSELAKYQDANSSIEGAQSFHDWLVSIANDQISCIDDDSDGQMGYLTRFTQDVQNLVSEEYGSKAAMQLDSLREGYIDLSTHCLSVFASVIFAVDFRALMVEFFTPTWYTKEGMRQAINTFDDYLKDYRKVLHPSLHDILVSELSSRLLASYLSCVRNKGAKFRRSDPFENKIRDDIETVFGFFGANATPDAVALLKQEWRVVASMTDFIASEKSNLPDVYQDFKERYWDAGMSWIEATLKTRDDYDRATMNAIKARAAAMEVVRGPETIMSKVK